MTATIGPPTGRTLVETPLAPRAAPAEGRRTRGIADQTVLLQATLVELIDLGLQAKQAHWNVVGPGFRPAHAFFDELADEARAWADTTAERMTALGSSPDGRADVVAATTSLPAMPDGAIVDRDALAALDDRVSTVASAIRQRLERLGDEDLATQDVLIEILRGLEKARWMLRAHRG